MMVLKCVRAATAIAVVAMVTTRRSGGDRWQLAYGSRIGTGQPLEVAASKMTLAVVAMVKASW